MAIDQIGSDDGKRLNQPRSSCHHPGLKPGFEARVTIGKTGMIHKT
jgi:hypothetical protein